MVGRALIALTLGAGLLLTSAPAQARPASSAGAAKPASGLPAWWPTRLTHLGGATQVLVVNTAGWNSTYAVARLFTRAGSGWRQELPGVLARVGWNGLVPAGQRLQNDGKTPAGTFGLRSAFGVAANPGTRLSYRQLTATSWWPTDPRDPGTYNVWQTRRPATATWRVSWAERFLDWRPQYDLGVVLGFNLPTGNLVAVNCR